jgi:hypothetical protein
MWFVFFGWAGADEVLRQSLGRGVLAALHGQCLVHGDFSAFNITLSRCVCRPLWGDGGQEGELRGTWGGGELWGCVVGHCGKELHNLC